MQAPVRASGTWRVPAAPALIWPIISDTARMNEAIGAPRYTVVETARDDGSVQRAGSAVVGGVALAWEEAPYEWVVGRRFNQTRPMAKGPFASAGVELTLAPDGEGSVVSYTFQATPRTIVGWLLTKLGFVAKTRDKVGTLMQDAARRAIEGAALPVAFAPASLPEGARDRAAQFAAQLDARPFAHGLARRLADHLLGAQEVDLMRIRPLRLARSWGVPVRHAIELCLDAARIGLLRLNWNILCPRCRGAKASVATLDQLPTGVHCPSCNIPFDRDFTRNVELTFQPAPSVRPIGTGEFCLAGPGTTPHVVVQQTLAPGERRIVAVDLAAGEYRYRTLDPGAEAYVDHAGGALPALVVDGDGAQAGVAGAAGELVLENRDARPRTLVVEARAWVADALTAHHVTTMQAFRDMFPAEVLRRDDSAAIDNVTLLFTDLKGSTALYERIGDGPAYRLVREHFAFLAGVVRDHGGALVKTMGDAVMAAFAEPGDAIAAALAMQRMVADFNTRQEGGGIVLRVGLHGGPCIAVTSNERLDYFGTMVNLAARLQGQSQGGDIVLSEPLAADPAVLAAIAGLPGAREDAWLKGFDRPVPFLRLTL